MARRLLARGWKVIVWNREAERYAEVPGAEPAADPAALRAACDIVLLCVLDGDAVAQCCFGAGGLAEAASGAALLVDMSTIGPDRTRALAARLEAEAGMRWIDAPLSGGPELAGEGRLTMLAGGGAEDLAAARPVLADLAANITHFGPLGAGQTAKIVNQAIVGVSYLLMAETLALAEAAGLDAARLPAALAGGLADSQALQRVFPRMQARAYDPPQGYARQLDKDLQALAAFVGARGLDLPLIAEAVARYHAFAERRPMEDSASVARAYDRQ
jgi:3-hydroxyisobutyrate dehydrogenase